MPRLLAPHPEPGQLLHQDILCAGPGGGGTGGPLGAGTIHGRGDSALRMQWVGGTCQWSEGVVCLGEARPAVGLFLDTRATSTATTSGTALPVSCWRMSSSWGEMLVLVVPAASSPARAFPGSQGLTGWGGRLSWPGGWVAAQPALRPDH